MLANALNFTKRFKRNQEGSTAAIFTVALVAMLGAGAFAIDVSNVNRIETKMQSVTDNASLAIAKAQLSSDADRLALAQSFFDARPDLQPVTVESVTKVGDVYTIQAVRPTSTFMMHLFGKDNVDVRTSSQTTYQVREFKLALVLDRTGSMGGAASGGGTKMQTLKTAANGLIDQLEAVSAGGIEVSVVPFSTYVNIGTSNRTANWVDTGAIASGVAAGNTWNGCVGSRLAPYHTRAPYGGRKMPPALNENCGEEMIPLTNDFTAVRAKIDSMSTSGWTYIPSGIAWGWRTLNSSSPFTQTASGGANQEKYMVIMTDGANTKSKNGTAHNGTDIVDANDVTEEMCSRVKGDGIQVYTIAYEVTDTNTQNMMRGCASNPDMYFNATDSASLYDAFGSITTSLVDLRLTN